MENAILNAKCFFWLPRVKKGTGFLIFFFHMYYNQYKNLQNGMVFLILKYVEKNTNSASSLLGLPNIKFKILYVKKRKKRNILGHSFTMGITLAKL